MADRTLDHRTLDHQAVDHQAVDHQAIDPADRALVARDGALPALAEVLNPTALAARLSTATGTPGMLSSPYLRYKRGTSCLLAVRWDVRDAGEGAGDRSGAAGTQHLLVRAYAEHARPKVDKAVRHVGPGELVHVDRAAGIVVTTWTADRDLPGTRLVPRQGDDDTPGSAGGSRLLRHNPERRAVLRLDGAAARDVLDAMAPLADPLAGSVAGSVGPGQSVLVRLSRPAAVERTLAGYGLLAASGARAPRVLAHDADRGVVVARWVPGDPLDGLDLAGTLDEGDLRAVGAAAAVLHTSVLHTSAQPLSARAEAGHATHRGHRVAPAAAAVTALLPRLAGAVEPLAAALDRSRAALPDRVVPVHGDLSLDQLVRAPSGELWFVDGDAARWGAPEEDLGSLAAALVRAHDDVASAADRLAVVLDGYAAAGAPGVDPAALRRATAEHLLRRAPEPFRRREQRWAETTERLVVLAGEVMAGRGWELAAVLDRPAPAVAPAPSATPVPESARPHDGIRCAPVALALADRLAADGVRLRAAVPRSGGRLLVVGSDRRGALVAGRWDDDRPAAARYAHRVGVDAVEVAGGGLVLHPGGQDPDLPELSGRLRPGAELVAHRAGRRAVVRDPAGTFTKVTRPGREPADVVVPPDAFATPAVVGRGPGRVTTAPLPGRTLHDLLGDPAAGEAMLDAAGHAIGRGLRRLQAEPAAEPAADPAADPAAEPAAEPAADPAAGHDRPRHDGDAEVAVVRRWWQLAVTHGATEPATAAVVVDRVALALADVAPRPAVPAHRDLHDKQLLVDPDDPGRVGLLDLDLATTAHPALDLANLLVHLELRTLQGLCPPERAARVARAVVAGYTAGGGGRGPAAQVPSAGDVVGWATAARARLAAVYAFRPALGDVPGDLTGDLPGDLPSALLAGLARPLTLPFPQLDDLLDALPDTQEDR